MPNRADAAYPDVRIASGPAFELIAQLAAFTSGPVRPGLDAGKGWIRDVRALAGTELLRRVEQYSLTIYAELTTIALDGPSTHAIDDLVTTMQSMDPAAFQRRLLGADSRMSRSMVSDSAIERAIEGDRAARAELLQAIAIDRGARQAVMRVLDGRPSEVRAELVEIVRDWARTVFPTLSPGALAVVARDVERRTACLDARGPAAAVTRATRGVAYDPPAWIQAIVLVPTVALRPFVIPAERGDTAVFICSVADEAIDPDPGAPPRPLVKVTGALGDERRLRVLRTLRDGDLTATEIAERLGVDRTSLHHHLGILRSAGLLAIRDDGIGGWRYGLRPDGWDDIGRMLDGYLASGAEPSTSECD